MQQPIQVDTLTSVTDVISSTADSLAALGAIGALLVALSTWRRQVNDARAAQASLVTLSVELETTSVEVENYGPLPIYGAVVVVGAGRGLRYGVYQERLGGEGRSYTEAVPELAEQPRIELHVVFKDAAGHYWSRSRNGDLKPHRQLEVQRQSRG